MNDRFKAWVEEERKRRGWSYRELARQSNVSQSLISRVLSDDMPATADFCIKIAQALEVSPETLMRLAGILPPASPASPADNTVLQELVELARNLPPDQQQQVLEYIRFISRSQ